VCVLVCATALASKRSHQATASPECPVGWSVAPSDDDSAGVGCQGVVERPIVGYGVKSRRFPHLVLSFFVNPIGASGMSAPRGPVGPSVQLYWLT
jgi:hypothetical protein